MKSLSFITSLPLLCVLFVSVSCTQEKAVLRIAPEKNSLYELEHEFSSTSMVQSIPFSKTKKMLLDLAMTPDSGGTAVKATFKRYQTCKFVPSDSIITDSDLLIPDSLAKFNPKLLEPWVWQGVKGTSFLFRIGRLGNIDSMDSFQPLLRQLTRNVVHQQDATILNNADFGLIWGLASRQFSTFEVSQALEMVFPQYAATAQKEGDTLKKTCTFLDDQNMTVEQTIRVKKIEDATVTFQVEGSGITNAFIKCPCRIEQQGKITVDRKTGIMISAYVENQYKKSDSNTVLYKSVYSARCKKILP